jgi:hypothetical protein
MGGGGILYQTPSMATPDLVPGGIISMKSNKETTLFALSLTFLLTANNSLHLQWSILQKTCRG